MRSAAVPILTIFTLLGFVLSIRAQHSVYYNAIIPRQSPSSSSTTASSTTSTRTTSTSISTTTSSHSSSTTSSTTPGSTTSSTTTSQTQTATFQTSSTSASEGSSTLQSTSTRQSTSSATVSTSQSTSSTSSTSTSLAFSDLTKTGLSLPTAFTSTFASTRSDGSSLTVTAVVSRPTGLSSGDSSQTKKGFFANTGAVAGTFVVAGLFGTGILLCAFLWVLRKYRRRRNDQEYFNDEYREFTRASGEHNRGTTPDPTLPTALGSTATPLSPAPNMIERLHGTDQTIAPVDNIYYDQAQGQYQDQSGEFDPYQTHGGASAYPDGYGNYAQYSQYGHYPGHGQQEATAYTYGPQHAAAPTQIPAGAGPSHVQQATLDSFHQVNPNLLGQAH